MDGNLIMQWKLLREMLHRKVDGKILEKLSYFAKIFKENIFSANVIGMKFLRLFFLLSSNFCFVKRRRLFENCIQRFSVQVVNLEKFIKLFAKIEII